MQPGPKPIPPPRKMIAPMLFVGALVYLLFVRKLPSESLSNTDIVEINGQAMGTTWMVKIPGHVDEPNKIADSIQEQIELINKSMSTYLADSEITQFNELKGTRPYEVSEHFHNVLSLSLEIHQQSKGAFDITIAPAVRAWGFGHEPAQEAPSAELKQELQRVVGSSLLQLGPQHLTKSNPEIEIDLSAVAKGYAVDVVSEWLITAGFPNHLVELGGELRASGKRFNSAWIVGIELPTLQHSGHIQSIPLQGMGMATSGDYRNYRIQDGERVSHTIDPRTLEPVSHNLASVTVIAEQAAVADAWATALSVLGPAEGLELAKAKNLDTLMLIRTADGFSTVSTAHFPQPSDSQ